MIGMIRGIVGTIIALCVAKILGAAFGNKDCEVRLLLPSGGSHYA